MKPEVSLQDIVRFHFLVEPHWRSMLVVSRGCGGSVQVPQRGQDALDVAHLGDAELLEVAPLQRDQLAARHVVPRERRRVLAQLQRAQPRAHLRRAPPARLPSPLGPHGSRPRRLHLHTQHGYRVGAIGRYRLLRYATHTFYCDTYTS